MTWFMQNSGNSSRFDCEGVILIQMPRNIRCLGLHPCLFSSIVGLLFHYIFKEMPGDTRSCESLFRKSPGMLTAQEVTSSFARSAFQLTLLWRLREAVGAELIYVCCLQNLAYVSARILTKCRASFHWYCFSHSAQYRSTLSACFCGFSRSTVHLAQRLESLCPIGSVCIDEATRHMLSLQSPDDDFKAVLDGLIEDCNSHIKGFGTMDYFAVRVRGIIFHKISKWYFNTVVSRVVGWQRHHRAKMLFVLCSLTRFSKIKKNLDFVCFSYLSTM